MLAERAPNLFMRSLKTPQLKSRLNKSLQQSSVNVKKVKQDAFVNRLYNGEKRNQIEYPTLLQFRENRSKEFIIKRQTASSALQLRLRSSNKKSVSSSKFANRIRN